MDNKALCLASFLCNQQRDRDKTKHSISAPTCVLNPLMTVGAPRSTTAQFPALVPVSVEAPHQPSGLLRRSWRRS